MMPFAAKLLSIGNVTSVLQSAVVFINVPVKYDNPLSVTWLPKISSNTNDKSLNVDLSNVSDGGHVALIGAVFVGSESFINNYIRTACKKIIVPDANPLLFW